MWINVGASGIARQLICSAAEPLARPAGALAGRCWAPSVAAFSSSASDQTDVLIVGAGHNGLVAATLLARQGLR